MSGRRSRTPGTPRKTRTRREQIAFEEIPTKDISKSKSVGGTPKTRRLITNSAPNSTNRRSCPEISDVKEQKKHFRRHSENRAFVVQPKPYINEADVRRKSLSQNNLVQPNVTNNSITLDQSDISTRSSTSSLSTNIYKLWKNGKLCDVIIHAGGTQFHVHRLVLAASCEQFEAQRQTRYQYDIPNVSAEVMNEVLDFFYTFKLKLTSANIEEVLEISQNLGARKLLDLCINFLMKINLNNAVRNRKAAQRFGLKSVMSTIDKYVHEHFSALITTSSFLESEFNYIYDIISSDILTKPNELQIFRACAQWIDYKRTDRIKYAIPLISLIRFAHIAPSDIVSQVESVNFIFEIPECKELLYNAFRHHALFDEGSTPSRSTVVSQSGLLHDNVQKNTGISISTAQTQHDAESSETAADLSCTATSMEYEVHSVQPAKFGQDCGSDNDPDIIRRSKRSTSEPAAHSQTTREDSSMESTLNNSSSTMTKEMQGSPCVKTLTEKFSKGGAVVSNKKVSKGATVSNKKVSNDLAHIIDFFEPTSKFSDQTSTNKAKKKKRLEDLLMEQRNNTRTTNHSGSSSNAKKSTFHDRIPKKDSDHEVGRIPSTAFTYLSTQGGKFPEYQKNTGNLTELSSIKSESESDLPPPPVPPVILIAGGASAYENNSRMDCVNNCIQQLDPELNSWRLRWAR
jgi:hypothetical protein